MSNQTASPSGARQYLHVAQAILSDIDDGKYQPGTLLPADREIAKAMSVSRPTVREALVALEVAGVVSSARGAGVRVSASRQTVLPAGVPEVLSRPRDLIEARYCMEPALMPLAVERLTEQSLDRLRQATSEFASLAAGPTASAGFARNGLAFHIALAEASGNSILVSTIENLASYEMHPLWVLLNQSAMRSPAVRSQQVSEHEAIVAALADRDAVRAADLLRAHLAGLRDLLFGPRDGNVHSGLDAGDRRVS